MSNYRTPVMILRGGQRGKRAYIAGQLDGVRQVNVKRVVVHIPGNLYPRDFMIMAISSLRELNEAEQILL